MTDNYHQNSIKNNSSYDYENEYFKRISTDGFKVSGFNPDKQNDMIHQFKPAELFFEIIKDDFNKIMKISNKSDYGIYAILLASLSFTIYKYSGNDDIIVGFPIRRYKNSKDTSYELLPIRCKINAENNFKTYLLSLGHNIVEIIKHRHVFLNETVKRRLVYKIALVMDNINGDYYDSNIDIDMVVSFRIRDAAIEGCIKYNSTLFEKETIERIAGHINKTLKEVLGNPDRKLADINILHEAEICEILHNFNDTRSEYSKHKTIHQLFEEQVEKSPNATALIFEDKTMTYRELNSRANQLACILISKGVKADSIVGIMVDRSFDMLIGIISILKAGGAYLPIDPKYPSERIKYMLEDSGAIILLTHKSFIDTVRFNGKIITLDTIEISGEDVNNSIDITKPNNLAYVIYTSGSTGKPKGVMIEHHSVINRLQWMQKKYPISTKDILLQKTPYTFDVSVWELFWWGLQGASLCLLEPGGEKDPQKIVDCIKKNKITVIHFVPSMLSAFLSHNERHNSKNKLKSLKRVFASGEALTLNQVNKFNYILNSNNGTDLVNLYGPTEATVDVTYFDCLARQHLEIIPIGKPIDNTKIYIIDEQNKLQPIGVPGELCISGVGLARGYRNNDKLTSEKFIANPFNPKERMYKTGDLAKWLPDGNIEYIGRIDNQVKIRGYRIELGEIEEKILRYDSIDQVLVLLKGNDTEKHLCAYYTAFKILDNQNIKEYLSKYLPDYMIPSFLIQLDKMPLSSNGKIDRMKLLSVQINPLREKEYIAPVTETEKKLVYIWNRLFGFYKIGVNDDFINLGGHSLKAIELVFEIHEEFNVKLPIGMIFKLSSIKNIANYVEKADKIDFIDIDVVEVSNYYPVSSAQNRMFILNTFLKESTAYNLPFIWEVKGELDVLRLEKAFFELIKRHEALRTSFHIINGEVMQKIHEITNFKLEVFDADNQAISKNFIKPFDLTEAPLIRVKLIRNSEIYHKLLLDIHHIISDAISIEIFFKELADLYMGINLPKLKVQYKDYSYWQKNVENLQQLKKQEDYWVSIFDGIIPELNMPLDYTRGQVYSTEGEHIFFSINSDLYVQLKNFSSENNLTLFTILFTAYIITLSKYTGQNDIVVGIPVSGRPHKDIKNVMGVFINTLAIRAYPEESKTVLSFTNEINEILLHSYENQDYPFDDLVNKLGVRRDYSRNPIFDTMFNLLNKPEIKISGLEFIKYEIETKNALFDIELDGEESSNGVDFCLNYNKYLYKRMTMQTYAKSYLEVAEKMIINKNNELIKILL